MLARKPVAGRNLTRKWTSWGVFTRSERRQLPPASTATYDVAYNHSCDRCTSSTQLPFGISPEAWMCEVTASFRWPASNRKVVATDVRSGGETGGVLTWN